MTTPQNILYHLDSQIDRIVDLLRQNFNEDEEDYQDIFDVVKEMRQDIKFLDQRIGLLQDTMNLLVKFLSNSERK